MRISNVKKYPGKFLLVSAFLVSGISSGHNQKNNDAGKTAKESSEVAEIQTESPAQVEIDSTIFNVQDLAVARVKDSLWLEEVYSATLFDEMYNTIMHDDFEDREVGYAELPTEL